MYYQTAHQVCLLGMAWRNGEANGGAGSDRQDDGGGGLLEDEGGKRQGGDVGCHAGRGLDRLDVGMYIVGGLLGMGDGC